MRRALWIAAALLASATSGDAQQTHALILTGLGGNAEYRAEFAEWTEAIHSALIERWGLPPANVTVLVERPAESPVATDRSTRDNAIAWLTALAGRAGADDRVLLVLIGHGTSQGDEARFNLPGPDLSPDDLATALTGLSTQTVAVVHTGSASGGFLAPLSGSNRVIVTATRSARERNATEFPRFLVEAFAGEGADLDKDGRLSVLEAFQYANLETARFYDEENEILTEHAVLDDDGDGAGSRDPGLTAADGSLAARFTLGSRGGASAVSGAAATDDPELARLYDERTAIQERLDALRAAKEEMTPESYEEDLEALLVELALKNREIRAREGGS